MKLQLTLNKTIFFLFFVLFVNSKNFASSSISSENEKYLFESTSIFKSLNISSGGKAESLGRAVSALCDDVSFFEYNPAVSSQIENTEIQILHNRDIEGASLETLNATFRKKNTGFGFQLKYFYLPFSEYNSTKKIIASNLYSETLLNFNLSHTFLKGYDFKGISLGFNIKGILRNVGDFTNETTKLLIKDSGLHNSAFGLMTDFGLFMKFNFLKFFKSTEENCAFGFTINNFGFALNDLTQNVKVSSALPLRISSSVSMRLFKPLLFTFEFTQPINLTSILSSEKFTFGSGIDLSLTKFLSFQGGIYFSNQKPIFSFGSEFDLNGLKINLAYTLDSKNTTINPLSKISLSAKMILGDNGRKEIQEEVQLNYVEGLSFYSKGTKEDILTAISKWEKAIELSSSIGIKFDPAIKAVNTAKSLLEAHEKINSVLDQ